MLRIRLSQMRHAFVSSPYSCTYNTCNDNVCYGAVDAQPPAVPADALGLPLNDSQPGRAGVWTSLSVSIFPPTSIPRPGGVVCLFAS